MKSKIVKLGLSILAVLAPVSFAFGFSFILSDHGLPVKWTPSTTTVVMKIMADNVTQLTDGSTRTTCIETAMTDRQRGWNRYLGNLQFVPQFFPAGDGADGNGVNEIFFSAKPYDKSWDTNTLAVTTVWLSGKQRTEADIIINSTYTWDSYRGSLRAGKYDLQRLVLHELGHVLGLGHPDQASPAQTVSAVMNSMISDVDYLTVDDAIGAENLYGSQPPVIPANDNFANAFALVLS